MRSGGAFEPARYFLYVSYLSPVASAARIPACFCSLNQVCFCRSKIHFATDKKMATVCQVVGSRLCLFAFGSRFQCTGGISRAQERQRATAGDYLCVQPCACALRKKLAEHIHDSERDATSITTPSPLASDPSSTPPHQCFFGVNVSKIFLIFGIMQQSEALQFYVTFHHRIIIG